MPKPRKYELLKYQHFSWRLFPRQGIWYADGRSNQPNPGKHSLGTADHAEARKLLFMLDVKQAEKLGLAKPSAIRITANTDVPLTLDKGWELYEKHIKRPFVAGGVKASTQKRYKAVIDKFLPFAKAQGVETWNAVNIGLVHSYAGHLDEIDYAGKTIRNEMVTVAQAHKWLVKANHLVGVEPLKLELRKVESERPYCYTRPQVAAMVLHCRSTTDLNWLADVIVGLATTGLRIAELAGLKWSDVNINNRILTLTDETGLASSKTNGKSRRQLKSGRSRSLPIYDDLAAVLNSVTRVNALVFRGPRGGRLKPDTVRQCLIRDVIKPLANQFPPQNGELGFADGRLHSFRHYFASVCANSGVPERVTMEWLGHADSDMVRHYYHLHDEEAQRQMRRLDLLGKAGQQRPGVPGAATNKKEDPSQGSDPTITT